MRTKRSDRTKCLVPECTRDAHARGLCNACLGKAARMISDGTTTWQQLEELRLSLPKQPGTGANPLGVAFERAIARQQLTEAASVKSTRKPRRRKRKAVAR